MTSTINPRSTAGASPGEPRSAFRFHPKLWLASAVLLALPALGMQVSREINWGVEDFAVFAVMLAGLCAAIEAALNWLTAPRWRIGAVMLGVLLFLTVWVHLAVGLI